MSKSQTDHENEVIRKALINSIKGNLETLNRINLRIDILKSELDGGSEGRKRSD